MTALLTESFALTPADLTTYGKWWSLVLLPGNFGNAVAVRAAGRSPGGWCAQFTGHGDFAGGGNVELVANLGADVQRVTTGFAWQDRGGSGSTVIAQWLDTNGVGLDLRTDANLRQFYVTRNGTRLFTFTGTYGIGRWHYIELAFFVSGAAGWVEGRLDSIAAGAYYGGAGTNRGNANGNTQAGSLSGTRWLRLGTPTLPNFTNGNYNYTDLVVMDGNVQSALQPNNDFLGDLRVVNLLTTGPGAHTDFAIGGSAPAATNWQSVNASPVPGNASYVQSNVVGAVDTYAIADLPAGTVHVYALNVGIIAAKSDAGVRTIAPLVRWAAGGPLDAQVGSGVGLQTNYAYTGQILETRPDGQPWAVADVNALEVGEKLTA